MLESLREHLSDAEDVGVNALVNLRKRARQIEDWSDDGIDFLRGAKPGPLMIGAAAISLGAMAAYALYSFWRSQPAKTRRVVAARARKEAGKISRKVARSAAHKMAEKMPGADKVAKAGPHKAMEKMANSHATKH
jgi:hypothetical protein